MAAVTVGATTLLLAGCGPEVGTVTGLTVDDDGRVVVAVAVCAGSIDQVLLSDWSDGLTGEVHREWPVEAEEGLHFVALATDGGDHRWQQIGVRGDQVAALEAYRSDHRWTSRAIAFTGTELDGLREGQIWWQRGERTQDRISTTVSEFESAACAWLRPSS